MIFRALSETSEARSGGGRKSISHGRRRVTKTSTDAEAKNYGRNDPTEFRSFRDFWFTQGEFFLKYTNMIVQTTRKRLPLLFVTYYVLQARLL